MVIKKIIFFFTLLTYFFLINYSKELSAETLSRNKLESFYVPEKRYAVLRDSTGNSGRFLGWELNFRLRFPILELVNMNLGYAYFEPGRFVESTARERKRDVHFFYTELTMTAF